MREVPWDPGSSEQHKRDGLPWLNDSRRETLADKATRVVQCLSLLLSEQQRAEFKLSLPLPVDDEQVLQSL